MNTTSATQDQRAAYQQQVDTAVSSLCTDARTGLNSEVAKMRLERYGRNELTAEEPVPRWKKFLAQFKDALVILLLVATVISSALWLYEPETRLPYEAMVIFAVVLLNAIMGYIQQSRARRRLQRCGRCRRQKPM